ncbi:hypothetical protein acdb102_05680 [Acidothermaceae bacterium B102]|nr:hypothetical protein acdb102_05680 [Acidothermaceae bacterium B102]
MELVERLRDRALGCADDVGATCQAVTETCHCHPVCRALPLGSIVHAFAGPGHRTSRAERVMLNLGRGGARHGTYGNVTYGNVTDAGGPS